MTRRVHETKTFSFAQIKVLWEMLMFLKFRDFGLRIAYTVSLVSDTSRPPTLCRPPIWQGGREISAPRPYETNPFHQPALFTPYT